MASFWCLFFLVLNSAFALCAALAFPRNTAVVAGQRMEMKCRNDTELSFRSWQMHRVSENLEQTIFQYKGQDSYFRQFGIERGSPGSVILYSNSTAPSDAGVYRCISFDSGISDLVTYSAHLIVFESQPECNTSLRGELIEKGASIKVKCSVRFKGNMVPQIEWRQTEDGSSNGGQLVAHSVTNLDSSHISSTLNINVDFPQPRIFTFKTFFLPPSTSGNDNAAANAPDYTYTWKSPPIGPPSAFSPSSSISSSSQAVKSSRQDYNDGETVPQSYLKQSASTSIATGTNGDSTFSFVFEHWILISVCVGVAVLVSVIVAALISCVRAKRQAAAKQVNGISMPQFGTYVEMQRSADTYCSISDEFVFDENARVPQQMLAQRSLSSPGHVRDLPRLPPAQPIANPSYDCQPPCYADKPSQKQRTNTMTHAKQNGRRASDITLTLPLSTSLPTIYQEDPAHPVKPIVLTRVPVENGYYKDPEASSYLAAQDVLVDEDLETIPSTYLRVNKLSERNC